MKKILFTTITMAIVLSCSKTLEPDITDNDARPSDTAVPHYNITLETALQSLDGFFASINEDKSVPDEINIAEVIRLNRSPWTTVKSDEDTDTSALLYIVNFENDAGYAVLAADSRLPTDIYALTENGRADESDFLSTPDGCGDFNPLNLIYKSALGPFTDCDTSILLPPVPPIQVGDTLQKLEGEWVVTHWGNWKTTEEVPAMLMTQWGQGSPYKDLTGAQYAGCGVTAVAQMMTYNQYPALLDDIKVPYDTLRKMKHVYTNSDYADDVAALFAHIFHGCKAKSYGGDGTLVWPKNITPYLKELGYKNVDIYRHPSKCNNEIVYASLDKGYPVLITATTDNLNGHTWVIDGYMKQFRSGSKIGMKTGRNYGTKYEYRDLMHCNWGKSGENNGYYYAGIFESYEPAVIPTTKGESDGYYKSFYRIITYEIPQ